MINKEVVDNDGVGEGGNSGSVKDNIKDITKTNFKYYAETNIDS